ncbi:MAG TPA: FAD-dependent oxidoreductase [Acidimicrobiales bacterium]|jgi:phytoene dehydrogenase-like protein|nr:FAD-dependent oxidoreductase [Acidimicrobiales bacterium]
MNAEWDVIVVGAGLAGLTAGATATKAGARTLVLDAHLPGGRAQVTERDGFVFNMGGHALYRAGAGVGVLRGLGIEPQGSPPPLNKYRGLVGDTLHLLPTGAPSLLRTSALGRKDKAVFASLLARLPLMKPARFAGQSVNQWIGESGLGTAAAAVLQALVRIGTYADDLDTLGADAAVAQLGKATKGVLYLDGGWAQLYDGLAAQCQVRTGVKVTGVEPAGGGIEVATADGALAARSVVIAAGRPAAVLGMLPADPGWGDLGPEVTAACIDAGVRRIPDPGYVLGVDVPLYATVQGPPARQAPAGQAVVAAIRYGATEARADRAALEAHLARAGVGDDDIVTSRFLARMVVAGAAPIAARGGLAGRPGTDATGVPGVFIAGDWVGPEGLIADAALASGRAAARRAVGQPAEAAA